EAGEAASSADGPPSLRRTPLPALFSAKTGQGEGVENSSSLERAEIIFVRAAPGSVGETAGDLRATSQADRGTCFALTFRCGRTSNASLPNWSREVQSRRREGSPAFFVSPRGSLPTRPRGRHRGQSISPGQDGRQFHVVARHQRDGNLEPHGLCLSDAL